MKNLFSQRMGLTPIRTEIQRESMDDALRTGLWNAYYSFYRHDSRRPERIQYQVESMFRLLWTDYFKPPHLEQYPDLHTTFWNAAKLCSSVKVEVNLDHANELMEAIEEIHKIFWATKNRDVKYYTAS